MALNREDLETRYLRLLPPSAALRETSRVVFGDFLLTTALAVVWSFTGRNWTSAQSATPTAYFWRSTVGDIIALNCLLVIAWFTFAATYGLSRLRRYRTHEWRLSPQVYLMTLPLLAPTFVASTIGFYAFIRKDMGSTFRVVLAAEIVMLLAVDIPIFTRWFPRMRPPILSRLWNNSLAVMLGKAGEQTIDEFYHDVVSFKPDFERHFKPRDVPSKSARVFVYYRHDTLAQFQRTLSCIYQTSSALARLLSDALTLTGWTMLDIGGGEGTFTCGLLEKLPVRPRCVVVVEPSVETLTKYKSKFHSAYPSIELIEHADALQDVAADLPEVDFLLASHSLYWMMDLDRAEASNIIASLFARRCRHLGVILMASKDSLTYEIKRMLCERLGIMYTASFGEDVLQLLPKTLHAKTSLLDSVIHASPLIEGDEELIGWAAYFCRLEPEVVSPHVDFLRDVINRRAMEYRCLPDELKANLTESGSVANLGIKDRSKVLLHKELAIITSTVRWKEPLVLPRQEVHPASTPR